MSSLFIELYLDEDVNILVADLLRSRGFVVATTRDEGQLGNSDRDQLAYCAERQKVMLTHNRKDFELLAEEYLNNGKTHFGVILAVRHPPYELVRRLLRILDHVTANEMVNQIKYI